MTPSDHATSMAGALEGALTTHRSAPPRILYGNVHDSRITCFVNNSANIGAVLVSCVGINHIRFENRSTI
eukprot:SAG11_NODE_11528_length_754_cov_2.279389_1_plen_69_part_10